MTEHVSTLAELMAAAAEGTRGTEFYWSDGINAFNAGRPQDANPWRTKRARERWDAGYNSRAGRAPHGRAEVERDRCGVGGAHPERSGEDPVMTLGEIAAAARERALPNNAFVLAGRLAYAHGISIGDNPIAVQRARSFYFWRAGWQAESISHECGLKNRLRPTLTRTIGELDGAYALRLLDVAIDIRMREAYGEK